MSLSASVALVTGASRGLGLAISRTLLRNGAKVSMLDVLGEEGERACDELSKEFSPGQVMFTRCDVTSKNDMEKAFEATKKRLGALNIVCNNAGIGAGCEHIWEKMVDININGMLHGVHLGRDYMSTKNGGAGGSIVNVASMAGLVNTKVGSGFPIYSATKYAVVGYTKCVSQEMLTEHGIRMNSISPGPADTDFNWTTRDVLKMSFAPEDLCKPEEIAAGVLELCTDTSKVGATMVSLPRHGLGYLQTPANVQELLPSIQFHKQH